MKRVERIHYLKRIINPLMLKMYGLLLATAGMLSLVSIKNVLLNMPSFFDMPNTYHFFVSALQDTELSVQAIFAVLCVLVVLFVRDAVRNLTLHTPYAARRARQASS